MQATALKTAPTIQFNIVNDELRWDLRREGALQALEDAFSHAHWNKNPALREIKEMRQAYLRECISRFCAARDERAMQGVDHDIANLRFYIN